MVRIFEVSSLRDRPVLVTGADGFIGSHLAERLLAEGASVRALCLYTSDGSHGWLDDLDPALAAGLDIRLGDVRDPEFVANLVQGVDTVFHLAALIAIPYSYMAPRSFVETNVLGTQNVLEAVRRHDVRRMVHTSTSEVYGTPDSLPITEAHPLKGQSPYSASKIAADKLCEAWACSFDTPVVVLRPFNTYGPRQSARAVIPTILGQLLAGVQILHLGSLAPRRDFTYVTDTVDGFVRAGTADLLPGEVVHLGTGVTVSIGDLVERAGQLLDVQPQVVVDEERVRPGRSEVMVLQSDPGRAVQRLGWQARIDLDNGLRLTAEWLRAHGDIRRVLQYQR